MNFKDLAAQVLLNKIEGANSSGDAKSALDSLVDGNKSFDLGEIVGKLQSSGGDLASVAKSWLGDGDNDAISASQIKEVIGGDKIAEFARKLGIGADDAGQKLSEILPELIDKSSQGGNLLDSIGGKGLLAGFATRFFGKSA
ncbi:MAG: DUF937 domain-containing protein [Gammaproteobacteria bacterium]|nr:DUF937 domain-containing protein [Gammaproteobacteria bacterium]